MKNINELSKHKRRVLRQYKHIYLDAINSQLSIYEKQSYNRHCPICHADKLIRDKECTLTPPLQNVPSYVIRCYHCLWYILEETTCNMWLATKTSKSIDFHTLILGDDDNITKVRNERIQMLHKWRDFIATL